MSSDEEMYGTYRRPEHSELPGDPRIKLLREVRRMLWTYMRCRPNRDDRCWKMAWEWAYACGRRNSLQGIVKRAPSVKWPSATEIASQYVFLVLTEMRSCSALRLPFHAAECVPASVAARPGMSSAPQISFDPTYSATRQRGNVLTTRRDLLPSGETQGK